MKRATRFPLKPERLTGLPSRAGSVKSGTSEPMRSVSVVICGSFLDGIQGLTVYCSPLVVALSNERGISQDCPKPDWHRIAMKNRNDCT